jgi:hypothetical protein
MNVCNKQQQQHLSLMKFFWRQKSYHILATPKKIILCKLDTYQAKLKEHPYTSTTIVQTLNLEVFYANTKF